MPDRIRRTEDYQHVLDEAERIAHNRGDGYVGVEHLALAILTDPDATPTRELKLRMGVDTGELVDRLGAFLDAPVPGPGQYRVRRLDGTTTIHPVEG